MTLPETKERLSEVLELFLSPNYSVVSPTYLDLLLTHITANTSRNCAGATSDYEYCDVFQEWVVKAISVWEANSKPMQPIAIFTLKLVGLIGKDELRFHYWHCQNVLNKLCTILELWQEDQAASVKMAYTTMLSDLVNHRSGRQWIIESGVWKGIIKFAHHNHTMYVTRESQKFLWSLLLAEQENREFCKQVILVIAAPLMSNSFDARLHPVLEDSYVEQNQLLCATLDSITGILENTLFQTMDNRIADMLEETIDLEMRVKALFEACISTKFLQHVHKLLILILFSKLKHGIKGENEVIDLEVWQKCRYRLYYICMMLLSKKYVIELVKTNKLTILYWKKLQGIRKFELPEKHRFEHQAICLMVLPLCVCVKKKYMKHDMFDMFINKLFDVTCTTIQRLAYNVRDVIWKGDLPLEQMCKVSIDLLLEIIDIMDRDVAVITFQTLCHVLKNYMPDIHDGPCNGNPPVALSNPSGVDRQRRQPGFKSILEGNPVVDSPVLLAALLNGIAVMTEKFKFKWQECVETICVLSLAQEILKHPGILPMICVKALKVCKLAIYNFMPPNLVLLVDTDSHMNDIGPTLYKRLHDPNWEVRDSVLEVLNTIAAISEDKYPAFQDFLLANEFLPLAVHVATSDSESYVRASALTFISSTVRINKLWDEKLSQLNLPTAAIRLLSGESEAIVRREAVILMKELYVYRKWPKSTIETMSRALAAAAALDLHWEVKTQALEFWKHFIKAHLADQGVLDGFFPKVTFSKEHRKIMALNETEIKRRLNKALDELARQFCLGVLLVTLDDDSDFAVCKASAAIMKKLKSFLLKYKMNEPLPVLPPARDSSTIDTTYQKQLAQSSRENIAANPKNADSSNVIEAIVDENDTNLLASIYKNSMKMDSESEDTEDKALRYISSVTRETFLQAIFDRDIDAYIEEKSRWLASYTNSFESVLDDILTMHKQGDVNSMDCY